jgi:type I restriction enzyme S subunit
MTETLVLHAAEETLEAVHTRRHAAYPAYKPSDVEWLGDVPEHWSVKRLKWDSAVFRGASPRPIDDPIYFDDDGEYAWVRISDVTAAGTYLRETKQRLSDLGASLSVKLAPGDLFLSIAGSVGKPCIAKIKCCIHDGFVYFPHLSCERKFLYYIFVSGEPYKGLGKFGTQLNLNTDTVGSISMAFPPLEEQQAIALFLDEQTRKIDDLIEAKRSLLDLLKEKRQAVITHAVTRGLDPAAMLKPSGVEWLGDVPEHWDVKRLKHLGRIRYGLGEPPEYVDNGLPFIRATDIYRGKINVNEVRRVNPSDVPWSRNPQLQDKDILIVRSGAYTGDSAIVTKDIAGSIAGYDMVMSVTKAEPEYIAYSLLGKHLLEGQIYLSKLRAAQPHLNAEELGDCLVTIPSEAEQSAIVNHVREETQKMDDLESVVREAIETLELLRAGIISAAVTGKIDVREEGV